MTSTAKRILTTALENSNMMQMEVANAIGFSKQQFNQRYTRDTMRIKEYFAALDCMNMYLKLTEKETGKEIVYKPLGTEEKVTTKMVIDALCDYLKITRSDVSAGLNTYKDRTTSRQALYERIQRDSMLANDMFRILDYLGIDYRLLYKDSDVPVEYKVKGHGESAKGMSNHIKFSTENSDAIANTFYLDGENEYHDGLAEELYLSPEGKYFMVLYKKGDKPKVEERRDTEAIAFIEKYGRIKENK